MNDRSPHLQAGTGRARLVDTQSFVFWVFAVAVVYSTLNVFGQIAGAPIVTAAPSIPWWALIVWSVYALLFLAIVYHHQLFVRRSPWVTVGALIWGGTVAVWFAGRANEALQDMFTQWFSTGFTERWGVALSAATNEEILKALGVVVLVLLPLTRVRSVLDGWFYGMMIGLGFQVVEDFVYTIQQSASLGDVVKFLLLRGLIAGLWAHAVYTGMVGAGIGYLVTRPDRPLPLRIAVAVGLFALAWTFHFLWDAPFLQDWMGGGVGAFFATVLIKGVPALVTLLLVVRWGRRHERSVWTDFVSTTADRAVVSEQDAADLLSWGSRRAARRAAAAAKGAHAGHLRKQMQLAQLRYVQALQEDGVGSTHAASWAAEVEQIRADPAFA